MYSEKIKEIKAGKQEIKRSVDRKQIEQMIKRFCTAEDAIGIRIKTLLDLFDEYCRENNYPIVNHQTLGRSFCAVFGLHRKRIFKDGKVCWIYVKKNDECRDIHLWMRGYVCTGESAPDQYCGTYYVKSLRDAVKEWADEDPERWKYIDLDSLSYWACDFYNKTWR